MSDKPKKLSTDPYKGVRDFFPADMAVQNHIFDIWKDVSRKYGYEEYGASVLEPAELYRAKTGEEIVNEQTYTFTDRGDREVTLRPEITPSVARMVAARKRELTFPLRWFSIPNLFRYEQPQRGRVREHWQLNVDIFGVESLAAEIEVISMAHEIVKGYGLKDEDFEIRINSRKLMSYVAKQVLDWSAGIETFLAREHTLNKLIDKKDKIPAETFRTSLEELMGSVRTEQLTTLLNSPTITDFLDLLPKEIVELQYGEEILHVLEGLKKLGITNTRFDPTLMRGFDYYTGIVFEVFDLNPKNRRAILGGGRYDDLLSLFGNEKVTAVGFGAGDVTARDLMETYGSLPTAPAPANTMICVVGEENNEYALGLAQKMRLKNIHTAIDLSGKKLGDQISNANKRGIPYIIVIGDEEIKTGKLKTKNLKTGEEKEIVG